MLSFNTFLKLQLTLEQHRFELCESTYALIFFNKYTEIIKKKEIVITIYHTCTGFYHLWTSCAFLSYPIWPSQELFELACARIMTSLYRWENWNPEMAAVCWRSHSLWVAEPSSSLLRWKMVSVHWARPARLQMWLGFSQPPLHREIVQCCFRLSSPLFIVLWAYTTSGNEEISLCSVVSDWLFLVFVLTQPPAVPSQPDPRGPPGGPCVLSSGHRMALLPKAWKVLPSTWIAFQCIRY